MDLVESWRDICICEPDSQAPKLVDDCQNKDMETAGPMLLPFDFDNSFGNAILFFCKVETVLGLRVICESCHVRTCQTVPPPSPIDPVFNWTSKPSSTPQSSVALHVADNHGNTHVLTVSVSVNLDGAINLRPPSPPPQAPYYQRPCHLRWKRHRQWQRHNRAASLGAIDSSSLDALNFRRLEPIPIIASTLSIISTKGECPGGC